jgi:hypothetical protein
MTRSAVLLFVFLGGCSSAFEPGGPGGALGEGGTEAAVPPAPTADAGQNAPPGTGADAAAEPDAATSDAPPAAEPDAAPPDAREAPEPEAGLDAAPPACPADGCLCLVTQPGYACPGGFPYPAHNEAGARECCNWLAP